MAYHSKTTNLGLPQWESYDKPERADFNEAFDKVDRELAKKAVLGGGNTAYVSKAGNNSTADGTAEKPFLTIQAAINFLGNKVVPWRKQIYIGDGIYTEALSIINCGCLLLSGLSQDRDKVIIKPPEGSHGINVEGTARCYLGYITIKMSHQSEGSPFAVRALGGTIQVDHTSLISEGETRGFIASHGCSGSIKATEISNCTTAITAQEGSTLFASNNTGSGNGTVLHVAGGTIYHFGTTPVGTTQAQSTCGQIIP